MRRKEKVTKKEDRKRVKRWMGGGGEEVEQMYGRSRQNVYEHKISKEKHAETEE